MSRPRARAILAVLAFICFGSPGVATSGTESYQHNVNIDAPLWVIACPAGDTVASVSFVPGRQPKLRVTVTYKDFGGNPKTGVPPDSIWLTLDTFSGNVIANDERAASDGYVSRIFADSSTNEGVTTITVPSLSGKGYLNGRVYIHDALVGVTFSDVRTVDTNADGSVTAADTVGVADLTFSPAPDAPFVMQHVGTTHRNALHGTPVVRTQLAGNETPRQPGTIGDGELGWSPSGKWVTYSARLLDIGATCAIFYIPASPTDGDTPTQFSFPPVNADSMDYDPSWSPLGTDIVWNRTDIVIYRKGVAGFNPDTTAHIVYASPNVNQIDVTQTAISPDGELIAFVQADVGTGGHFRVYTVPMTGGAIHQVTNIAGVIDDYYPQWTPDGTRILFERHESGGTMSVLSALANGTEDVEVVYTPPTLLRPGNLAMPASSPDGEVIVSALRSTCTPHTIVPAAVGGPVAVENYSGFGGGTNNLLSPRLSNDGTRLGLMALAKPGDQSAQVFAVVRNMNLPPTITAIGGSAIDPDSPYVARVIGQDSTIELSYTVVDAEGDELSDNAYFLRGDMSFYAPTRTLTWPVGDTPVGTYAVKFAVAEKSGGSAYALARITVRDITRPAATTNLSFDVDPYDCTLFHLSWTAPADDSTYSATGPAVQYSIKTSTTSIGTNWTGGVTKSAGTPGSTEAKDITVVAGQSVYVRLKTQDDVGNWSVASNQIHIDGPPVNSECVGEGGMFAGGGDGGGASLVRAPGAAAIRRTELGSSGVTETSVLNGVASGSKVEDAVRMSWAGSGEGAVTTRVREISGKQAVLDAVRVLVVDHPADLAAYRFGGSFVLGTRQGAASVRAGSGSDLTALLDNAAAYLAVPGETLAVDLGPRSGTAPMVIGSSGRGSMEVLVADTTGAWQSVKVIHPRSAYDEAVLAAPGTDHVRLVCAGAVTVGFLGHLAVSSTQPTVQTATLLSAHGPRVGDVLEAVGAIDSLSTSLTGPDTLQLSYSLPEVSSGARDLFLVVAATSGGSHGAGGSALKRATPEAAPLRFALEQNRPNPFSGRTNIRFALASATPVRLEVFDASGRRVRTLALGSFVPGPHAVEWDHRDTGGNLVRPGVYVYRLIAGSFRDQKKMMLLAN